MSPAQSIALNPAECLEGSTPFSWQCPRHGRQDLQGAGSLSESALSMRGYPARHVAGSPGTSPGLSAADVPRPEVENSAAGIQTSLEMTGSICTAAAVCCSGA